MTVIQSDSKFLFTFSVDRGLTPQSEGVPGIPTVADFRRLRRVIVEGWKQLSEADRNLLYSTSLRMLTARTPPLGILLTLPQATRAVVEMWRVYGMHGMTQMARELDIESKALYQDVISLWENDQVGFAQRVEESVRASQEDRGTRVQTRSDLRAVLDDLF